MNAERIEEGREKGETMDQGRVKRRPSAPPVFVPQHYLAHTQQSITLFSFFFVISLATESYVDTHQGRTSEASRAVQSKPAIVVAVAANGGRRLRRAEEVVWRYLIMPLFRKQFPPLPFNFPSMSSTATATSF